MDALPCRTGREAGSKFGGEPAIDARNEAGFGCGLDCASCIYIAMPCKPEICGLCGRLRFEAFSTTIISVTVTTLEMGKYGFRCMDSSSWSK